MRGAVSGAVPVRQRAVRSDAASREGEGSGGYTQVQVSNTCYA